MGWMTSASHHPGSQIGEKLIKTYRQFRAQEIQQKKKNGGECGSHTLRDMLDLNNIQSDKVYLKWNNESRKGAEKLQHTVYSVD